MVTGESFLSGFLSPPKSLNRIMLPNEEFALACRAYYEEQGIIVNKENGVFAHCPLTRHECETGYYLLWEHHQHQGLLQSRDLDKCCFFAGDALKWLRECDYFPDNYFELWDIYETYTSANGEVRGRVNKEEKLGICNPATHLLPHVIETKRKNGRKISSQFQKEGVGIFDPAKEEEVLQGAIKSGKQAVENKSGIHDPANKDIVLAASVYARDNNLGIFDPENKDKVIEGSKKAGRISMAQRWISTVDGYISSAPLVARHNKRNGWDPEARIRIS
jgi:hypothetical protein